MAARREERLRVLVDEMGGESAGHSLKTTDVSSEADALGLEKHVRDVYGRCDVLVNNAGFNMETNFTGPESIEQVERVMETNFLGAVRCTAHLLDLLKQSAPASVVNVSSVAGRLAFGGASPYCASKFALVGWSEALHWELADQGVHVSLVEPGFISTEGFPERDLVNDPVMRYLLGTPEGVSEAILDAIEGRKLQRVTPRWYYLMQFPRLVTPPLWRLAMEHLVKPRQARRDAYRDQTKPRESSSPSA